MRSNRCSSSVRMICLGLLAVLFTAITGCGGGGGGGGGVSLATIKGSVSGTIIMAIDETGKIAAKDDTAGRTPVNGKFPFTLTVPPGHQYTIQFIVTDNVTGVETVVPLYQGAINIFSVASTGTLDLGFVDTSGKNAAADNNILTQPGVTPGGTTPPPTIMLAGYRYLNSRDESNGAITARFHVEVRDPSGTTPVTDKALIRDVAIFDNAWKALPLSGAFALWNGTNLFTNDASGNIVPAPRADVEATLAQAPSGLTADFYNVAVTDNAGNLHNAKVYFRQPVTVAKPSNLAQAINADNSITLTWTNPTFPAGPQYDVRLVVQSDDLDGDTINDYQLMIVDRTPPFRNSYTIPESFVASNLVSKSGLKWHVQIRQYDNTIVFPDGTSQGNNTQFYRNNSAVSPLTLPSVPATFAQADLTGTWDTVQLVSGLGAGWDRGTATIDGSGNITISNLETTGVPPSTAGIRWTLDSSGVVSETVNGAATLFHGTMSSSKDLLAGVQSISGSTSLIRIARKRVPGVTYGNADLANKSFVYHSNESGAFVGWGRGSGNIDGSGQIRLTSGFDDVGPVSPPVDPSQVVGQFLIDGNGIVREASDPLFKGFITPDKTTMFFVNTNVANTSSSYQMLAVSLVNPAKTFLPADLEGTYRLNAIWSVTTGWAYGSLVMGASGGGSLSGTNSFQSFGGTANLSITSNGTVGSAGNTTFHGTLSSSGSLLVGTATNRWGLGEQSLELYVK